MSEHRIPLELFEGMLTLAYNNSPKLADDPQTIGLTGRFVEKSPGHPQDPLASVSADVIYMMAMILAAAEAALTQLEEEE